MSPVSTRKSLGPSRDDPVGYGHGVRGVVGSIVGDECAVGGDAVAEAEVGAGYCCIGCLIKCQWA